MKRLLIFIVCFWTSYVLAQAKTNEAEEVNVYGRDGKSIIAKVILNNSSTSKLFLLKSIQREDSGNNYVTTLYLGNKETTAVLDIRLLMKFSKPVDNVSPSFSTAFNNVNGLSDDHITYAFKSGRLDRDPGSAVVISFMIKSKEKVVTEISGLDGVLQ